MSDKSSSISLLLLCCATHLTSCHKHRVLKPLSKALLPPPAVLPLGARVLQFSSLKQGASTRDACWVRSPSPAALHLLQVFQGRGCHKNIQAVYPLVAFQRASPLHVQAHHAQPACSIDAGHSAPRSRYLVI